MRLHYAMVFVSDMPTRTGSSSRSERNGGPDSRRGRSRRRVDFNHRHAKAKRRIVLAAEFRQALDLGTGAQLHTKIDAN